MGKKSSVTASPSRRSFCSWLLSSPTGSPSRSSAARCWLATCSRRSRWSLSLRCRLCTDACAIGGGVLGGAFWRVLVGLIWAMFVAALFITPPYTFAPEDNLAYADYVRLHERTDSFIETKYPRSRVLTAWTATDELSKPFLGYVSSPVTVTSIEDFSLPQLQRAQQEPETYDVALVFSTKYVAKKEMWMPGFWRRAQEQYFGLHSDLPPEAAAQILSGTIVFKEERGGQWAAVLVFDRARNAQLR